MCRIACRQYPEALRSRKGRWLVKGRGARFHFRRAVSLAVFLMACPGVRLRAAEAVAPSGPESAIMDPALMPVNTWIRIPGSRMLDVTSGGTAPAAIFAYSGGVMDTRRNRLVVWGGGHAACNNNEVYAFDINALRWLRLTDPTANPADDADVLWDGNPGSRHTYNGMAYMAHVDKLLTIGGSCFGQGHANTRSLWSFDFASTTWSNRHPAGALPGGGFECIASYDPETGKMWLGNDAAGGQPVGLYSYDYGRNSWTRHTSDALSYRSSALDTRRGLLVVVGGGQVLACDVRGGDPAARPWATTGADAFIAGQGMGLDYDPVADRVVGFNGDGNIYALDPVSKAWTVHTPAGGRPKHEGDGRTWGRFRYVPADNAYVTVMNAHDTVYFYKLTPGIGTGTPLVVITPVEALRAMKGIGEAAVRVTRQPATLAPEPVMVEPMGSCAFSARVTRLPSQNVMWSVSGGGTIDSAGLFKSNGQLGTFTVRAVTVDRPSASGEFKVRVAGLVLRNSGFEAPGITGFQYAPAGAGWTFEGAAGIQNNRSEFVAMPAPEGEQTAFLGGNGVISQNVFFPGGAFTISYQAAIRRSKGGRTMFVGVGDRQVDSFTPPASGAFELRTSAPFTVSRGVHVVKFWTGREGGDDFLDAVELKPAGNARALPAPGR